MTNATQLPAMPLLRFTETIRGVPCITVTEHEHLIRAYALQARAQVQGEPVLFIHPATFSMNQAHVGAWKPGHELPGYLPLYTTPQPAQATQAEVTDAEIVAVMRDGNNCNYNDEAEHIQFARAILSQQPVTGEPVALDDAGDTKSKAWAWDGVCAALNEHWPQWSAQPTNGAACATLAIADMAKAASTHPAPSVPDDMVRDAERFRRLNLTEEAIAVVDSMLAAKEGSNGKIS